MDLSPLDIEFHDFGINKSLLNLFTDKHLFNYQTIRQLEKLKQFLKTNSVQKYNDFVEQEKRLNIFKLILNHKFEAVVKKENVYNSYQKFFKSNTDELKIKKPKINNLLILPDARTSVKSVPNLIVNDISSYFKEQGIRVNIAKFHHDLNDSATTLLYSNFEQLIDLINKHDFVIGADSLPIHLCNLLNKPHYILYHHNKPNSFCTLFCLQNNFFTNFNK
jgi:ADP-heptose:LPS heptosyltransferase